MLGVVDHDGHRCTTGESGTQRRQQRLPGVAHTVFASHEDQARAAGVAQKPIDLFRLPLAAEQTVADAVHASRAVTP